MASKYAKPVNFPTAWSYSRLADYRKCPRKFKYKYVDKLPEPKAPAMERGTAIHEVLQKYVEGGVKTIPKELVQNMGKSLAKTYTDLRKAKAACELELAVDVTWNPTSWFDRTTWTRAKLDVELWVPKEKIAYVYDTKTGKERAGEHAEQCEIYAVVEWAHRPLAETVVAKMLYVDLGDREASAQEMGC
jgi:hypothetical protein